MKNSNKKNNINSTYSLFYINIESKKKKNQ